MEPEFLRSYREAPPALLDEISIRVGMYSTVLLRHSPRGGWEPAGSGTLVRCGEAAAILTAGHVIARVGGCDRLGLAVMQDDHLFEIDSGFLTLNHRYDSETSNPLPDLGFIRLPSEAIGSIEARHKLFCGVDSRRDRALTACGDMHQGMWLVWGAPSEFTRREPSVRESGTVECFQCLAGFTAVEKLPDVNGYDALAASVNYADCSAGVPQTFRGFSGGGLWLVRVQRGKSGDVQPLEYLLVGVACFQSDAAGDQRTITCHGPRGLYSFMDQCCASVSRP